MQTIGAVKSTVFAQVLSDPDHYSIYIFIQQSSLVLIFLEAFNGIWNYLSDPFLLPSLRCADKERAGESVDTVNVPTKLTFCWCQLCDQCCNEWADSYL